MRILYDFDGTLFDTYPAIVENIYTEVSASRKHLITREDVYKLAKVNAKLAMDMLEFTEEQRRNVYSRQFDVVPELNPPFPHIEKVLKSTELNVIMTHKSGEAVRQILEHYGMSHYFEEVVSKDSGFPKKPNADSYRYLHEKYGIDLAIGDRQLDLLPAKELGILTCSFRNYLPEADYYIDDYSNYPLVALGVKYGIPSHNKEMPKLSEEWLTKFLDKGSEDYQKTMKVVQKSNDKEVAYLHRIGLSPLVKRTGFYPLDGALFALEHGFPGSVVKTILLHNGFPHNVESYSDDIQEMYRLFENFLTDYVSNRIKKFNEVLEWEAH